MPPLVVEILPSNDNSPIVTLTASELDHNETAPPILIFQGLTIADFDDTPCNQQLLVAAQVIVETVAPDSSQENLMVRISGLYLAGGKTCGL